VKEPIKELSVVHVLTDSLSAWTESLRLSGCLSQFSCLSRLISLDWSNMHTHTHTNVVNQIYISV